jgi:lipoprotein NlpI
MAANSGSLGLVSYLVLIGFMIYQFATFKTLSHNLRFALLAGFVSLSVSNFFGFSVVPTQLQFFLFPAIALGLANEGNQLTVSKQKISNSQKIFIISVLIAILYLLITISKYWYADILYTRGKTLSAVPRPDLAIPLLSQAIKLEPDQAIYYGDSYGLATTYANVAIAYNQVNDATHAAQFIDLAKAGIQKATTLAPANINIRRVEFGVYVRLSTIEEKYLIDARNSLAETIKMAPTDAKLYYNLGIADANLGRYQDALTNLQKAIELKANYADARIEYAALLIHLKQLDEAKKQLNYILTNIDPTNSTAKQALENIK